MNYVMLFLLLGAMVGCGKNGKDGASGSNGVPGLMGPAGPVGPQGSPGIDGTSVTVVKFCPGTTVYPSKFIEIGFCVDGKLYGTYSANGGFSTELPPGTYGSNGINASCNFTIGANCQVTN